MFEKFNVSPIYKRIFSYPNFPLFVSSFIINGAGFFRIIPVKIKKKITVPTYFGETVYGNLKEILQIAEEEGYEIEVLSPTSPFLRRLKSLLESRFILTDEDSVFSYGAAYVPLRKKQKYISVSHGLPSKKPTYGNGLLECLLRLWIKACFSFSPIASSVFVSYFRKLNLAFDEPLFLPFLRAFLLKEKRKDWKMMKRKGKKKMLVAFSWENEIFFDKIFCKNLKKILQENGVELYIRFHPRDEQDRIKHSRELLKILDAKLILHRDVPNIYDVLHEFDYIVSDRSSIVLDLLLCDDVALAYFDNNDLVLEPTTLKKFGLHILTKEIADWQVFVKSKCAEKPLKYLYFGKFADMGYEEVKDVWREFLRI